MQTDGRYDVLLVENNPQVIKTFRKLFQLVEQLAVPAYTKSAADALDLIRSNPPDVILVEQNLPDMDGLRFLEMVRQEFPVVQIVLLSPEKQYDFILRAMRSGAFDVVNYDVSQDEFIEVIKRGGEQARVERKRLFPVRGEPREAKEELRTRLVPGNIISVYSPKGGMGVTTIAINLALALRSSEYTVAMVDAALQFGDVALLFNEIGKLSLLNLMPWADEIDAKMIEEVMIHHKTSGIHLLPAPMQPEITELVTGEKVTHILGYMRDLYRFNVINTQPFLNETNLAVLDNSDAVVLPLTQEITAIRAMGTFLDLWDGLGLGRDRLSLVINRYDEKSPLNIKKISERLKMPVRMTLPYDPGALKAANLGVPIYLNNRYADLSQAFSKLAEMIHKDLGDEGGVNHSQLFTRAQQ